MSDAQLPKSGLTLYFIYLFLFVEGQEGHGEMQRSKAKMYVGMLHKIPILAKTYWRALVLDISRTSALMEITSMISPVLQ